MTQIGKVVSGGVKTLTKRRGKKKAAGGVGFSGWGGWKGDASLLFQCKSALTVLKRDKQGGDGRAL